MDNTAYANGWFANDVDDIWTKIKLEEWKVSNVYPFTIEQQEEKVLSSEYKSHMASLTARQKQIIKMTLNSTYGLGGLPSNTANIWATPGGASFNHPGVSSHYYSHARLDDRKFPHEETALCVQKEKLVEHYKNKVKKLSYKKKKEIETLKKIIDITQQEIDVYVDEFPERFI